MSIISIAGFSCSCGGKEFNVQKNGFNKLVCLKCRAQYEFVARDDILSRAPKEGRCKGCGAPIRWIKMSGGKLMPVNSKRQNFVILSNGTGEIMKGFVPHWATCPARDKFKKKPRTHGQ